MVPYVQTLAQTPTTLMRILQEVPRDRFDERPADDRFSLTEMIAHLADHEVIALDRIVKAVEADGVHVHGYDVDERAAEKDYASRDPHHELEVFGNRRRETFDTISKFDDIDMQKHFIHSESGPMTVAEAVSMLMGHDLYHLHQASEYLTVLHEREV